MSTGDLISTSYVLVHGGWSVSHALDVFHATPVPDVIVHRVESGEDYYYLFTDDEFLRLLDHRSGDDDLTMALELQESAATPTSGPFPSTTSTTESRVIVGEHGSAVGFVRPQAPPPVTRGGRAGRRRGVTTGGGEVARELTAEMAEQVKVDEVASLLVGLSSPSGSGPGLEMELDVGSELDVIVQAKRGFVIEGANEARLTVESSPDPLPARFRLKATELGRGSIRVLAFVGGQSLGAIDLAPSVVPANVDVAARPLSREQPLAPVAVTPPDLVMVILETTHQGAAAFEARLQDTTGRLNFKRYGPIKLRKNPETHFKDFFDDIETMPLKTPAQRLAAAHHLAAKGAGLFEEVVPEGLRAELWRLRHEITTVQIQSEEPWIPWELCKLVGSDDTGRAVEGGHLCEEFAVTRWLLGVPRQREISLTNLALVVPDDSGLPFAEDERDYLLALSGVGREVSTIPAIDARVRAGLASGMYDGWHFSGHGGFRNPNPDRSAMVLQDGQEFTPEDISGVVANLGQARPLVFLNACQIGRSAMGLTGIGGWASKFLKAGASSFIGAYWSVYDRAAYEFARTFYESLLAGKSIAISTQDARRKVNTGGDPTWLAYTVFAEPTAHLT